MDEYLKEQLKAINEHIGSINETLIRQEESLKHHIYRTELAEEAIKELRNSVEPIKKHVAMWDGALKLFGVLSLFVGIAAGVAKILYYFGFQLPM